MRQSARFLRARPRPRGRHNQARPWLEPLEIRNLLTTFSSGGVELPIVWANVATGGLVSQLNVPVHMNIADLNVGLDISHPWDADLNIYLVSPANVTIPLSRFHGYGSDFSNTTFDDEAAIPIRAGSPPFEGTYRPDGRLSSVDNTDAFGTWKLHVDDWPFGPYLSDGTLHSWSLSIEGGQPPPTVSLAVDRSSIAENGGVATVTASLSAATDKDVTVNLGFGGTASNPADYTASANFIRIPAGQTTGSISLAAVNDTLDEPDETIAVRIASVINASVIGTQQVTTTIIDDDPPPTISINDVTVTEGDSGSVSARFTVALSAVSGKTITVNYATANGTASAGSDYLSQSGTLTIPAGSLSGTITVPVLGDTLHEADETFFVNLSNPTNATIADGQGMGTILDDDPVLPPGTASFLGPDSATQGGWKSAYGGDGYLIAGDATSVPTYATVALAGQSSYTWAASTTDPRALQKASPLATDRVAATWFSDRQFTLDVAIRDGQAHRLALYALDWDNWNGGRSERVDVLDAATGVALDSRTITGFQGGVYLRWTIGGHVLIRVTNLNPASNAVLSGIFFGDAPIAGATRFLGPEARPTGVRSDIAAAEVASRPADVPIRLRSDVSSPSRKAQGARLLAIPAAEAFNAAGLLASDLSLVASEMRRRPPAGPLDGRTWKAAMATLTAI